MKWITSTKYFYIIKVSPAFWKAGKYIFKTEAIKATNKLLPTKDSYHFSFFFYKQKEANNIENIN